MLDPTVKFRRIFAAVYTLLSAALAQRDESGAKLLDKLLTSVTKRFTLLMDELRAERQGGRRSVLVVGAAQHVHVGAGE